MLVHFIIRDQVLFIAGLELNVKRMRRTHLSERRFMHTAHIGFGFCLNLSSEGLIADNTVYQRLEE